MVQGCAVHHSLEVGKWEEGGGESDLDVNLARELSLHSYIPPNVLIVSRMKNIWTTL